MTTSLASLCLNSFILLGKAPDDNLKPQRPRKYGQNIPFARSSAIVSVKIFHNIERVLTIMEKRRTQTRWTRRPRLWKNGKMRTVRNKRTRRPRLWKSGRSLRN
ncbi:hypothetical protein C1H46_030371 [Malus baccata]|uniref:Uncharacterized protein n=1 Tax=Malus baccata TaxID=106549 RepID=A0A540LCG7_MALBA|nr:hypothetical protein C1H46_030371 [Malus baccata]